MLLQQNATQQGRIGNTVRPVKVMFNCIVRSTPYNAAINLFPQTFEIYVTDGMFV